MTIRLSNGDTIRYGTGIQTERKIFSLVPLPVLNSPAILPQNLQNQKIFCGEVEGRPEGLAYLKFSDGMYMIGQWKNGCLDGKGIARFPDGSMYSGEWKNGIRSGFGTIQFASGETYTGNWREDRMDGQGVLRDKEGNICFFGNWMNGRVHGEGIVYSQNQPKYESTFKDGNEVIQRPLPLFIPEIGQAFLVRCYVEEHVLPDGSIYIGEWQGNCANGLGFIKFPDGKYAIGNWQDGELEGKGFAWFPNKSSYYGEWKKGLKNGPGVLRIASGVSYSGEWRDGKMHGKGTYHDVDGAILNVENGTELESDETVGNSESDAARYQKLPNYQTSSWTIKAIKRWIVVNPAAARHSGTTRVEEPS